MFVTLEHLPDEMLAIVVEQMPGASRKAFSLVNRRMRAVTRPILFRTLPFRDPDDGPVSYFQKMDPAILALCTTLRIGIGASPPGVENNLDWLREAFPNVIGKGFSFKIIELEIMLPPPYARTKPKGPMFLPNANQRGGGPWYRGWLSRYPKHVPISLAAEGSAVDAQSLEEALAELSKRASAFLGIPRQGAPALRLVMSHPDLTSELHLARCASYLDSLAHILATFDQPYTDIKGFELIGTPPVLFTVKALSAWYVR